MKALGSTVRLRPTRRTAGDVPASPRVRHPHPDALRRVARALTAGGCLALALALCMTSSGASSAWAAGNGGLDPAFATALGTNADVAVNSVVVQGDGKVLVGGDFSHWLEYPTGGLVRLNGDGTVDTAFAANTTTIATAFGPGLSYTEEALVLQPDGKIIVSQWKDIVRLNSDGTVDKAFASGGWAGADDDIESLAVQPDGKILVGGAFTRWNGLPAGGIVRLNPDGSVDSAFTANTGSGAANDKWIDPFVESITVLRDGKLVLGGVFNAWNGTRAGRLVRLNPDGTLDRAFTANTGTGANPDGGSLLFSVSSIVEQPDSRIVLGGYITKWDGRDVNGVVRLNPDGTLDRAFATNIGRASASATPQLVRSVALQANGKLVVAGEFERWYGSKVGNIVRLNANGTRDKAFTLKSGSGATCDENRGINAVTVQGDGKILLGGYLLRWNGKPVGRVLRLMKAG